MGVDFDAAEVLDLAKRIERRAEAFYKFAAQATGDSQLRGLFLDLAKMESEHEQIFDAFSESSFTGGPKGSNAAVHWPAIANTLLFNLESELKTRFADRRTTKDILTEAMAFEKDTVIFFMAMKDMVTARKDKARVDDLIREEMGHIIQLGSRLVAQR